MMPSDQVYRYLTKSELFFSFPTSAPESACVRSEIAEFKLSPVDSPYECPFIVHLQNNMRGTSLPRVSYAWVASSARQASCKVLSDVCVVGSAFPEEISSHTTANNSKNTDDNHCDGPGRQTVSATTVSART
jgi:hypothetical protein